MEGRLGESAVYLRSTRSRIATYSPHGKRIMAVGRECATVESGWLCGTHLESTRDLLDMQGRNQVIQSLLPNVLCT